MKIVFTSLVALGIVALILIPLSSANADCVEGPADVWNCTGSDVDGMNGLTGADTVTVQSGATVSNSADAIKVDGDTVADSVTNNGTITSTGDDGIDGEAATLWRWTGGGLRSTERRCRMLCARRLSGGHH